MDEPLVRAHVEMLHRLAAPLAGEGKLVLVRFKAANPKQKALVRHFAIGEVDAMVASVKALAAEKEHNLYIPLAVMRPDLPDSKKGGEDDVVGVLGLVADLDDDRASDWPTRMPRPPDFVIESSSGRYQAGYVLDEAAGVDAAKPVAEALQTCIGCDSGTKDVSHVWRIPGTRNWPTKPKLAAGRPREPQPVGVVQPWNGNRTRLAELAAAVRPQGNGAAFGDTEGARSAGTRARQSTANDQRPTKADREFVASLPDGLRRLIEQPTPHGHRSHALNTVILALLDRGLDPEPIEALIRRYPGGIGAKYIGRSDLHKEIARIAAYWRSRRERESLPPLERMNADHALLLIGNGASVLYDTLDTEGQPEDRFLGLDAFRTWYGNAFIEVSDKLKPLADWWLKHPQRRSYRGLVFAPLREAPGYYNLWKGFAVKPSKDGDWSLFREHLLKNVSQGDEGLFTWVLGWFAQIVQHPEERPGTSLAIRGKQGTGKSKTGEVVGSLFPRHYLLADTSEQVVGKFNSHMASLLLLHADEAFFAGDPRSAGRLKSLITAHTNSIERKGQDIFQVRNNIRLLITSNERWVVPAALDERRFAVLDIGERNAKDASFFRRLDDQLDDGGRERLLHDLQTFDLSTVDLRTIPATQALQDQKLQSLEPEAAWWLDTLRAGTLSPRDDDWPKEVACETVHDLYARHASRTGVRRRSSEVMFGTALRRLVPDLKRRYGTVTVYDDQGYGRTARRYVYVLPPLDECRTYFESTVGRAIEWDDDLDGGEP